MLILSCWSTFLFKTWFSFRGTWYTTWQEEDQAAGEEQPHQRVLTALPHLREHLFVRLYTKPLPAFLPPHRRAGQAETAPHRSRHPHQRCHRPHPRGGPKRPDPHSSVRGSRGGTDPTTGNSGPPAPSPSPQPKAPRGGPTSSPLGTRWRQDEEKEGEKAAARPQPRSGSNSSATVKAASSGRQQQHSQRRPSPGSAAIFDCSSAASPWRQRQW